MIDFLKESLFFKPSHVVIFVAFTLFFIGSHLFGISYFNEVKTENSKVRYSRSTSFYHK